MDKDKYIDEIADILQETDDRIRKTTMHDCATYGDFARALIDADYLKADEVRKETIDGAIDWLKSSACSPEEDSLVKAFIECFGTEVDE